MVPPCTVPSVPKPFIALRSAAWAVGGSTGPVGCDAGSNARDCPSANRPRSARQEPPAPDVPVCGDAWDAGAVQRRGGANSAGRPRSFQEPPARQREAEARRPAARRTGARPFVPLQEPTIRVGLGLIGGQVRRVAHPCCLRLMGWRDGPDLLSASCARGWAGALGGADGVVGAARLRLGCVFRGKIRFEMNVL
jgi:hypothetical protein